MKGTSSDTPDVISPKPFDFSRVARGRACRCNHPHVESGELGNSYHTGCFRLQGYVVEA